jgi:hypothetical protein
VLALHEYAQSEWLIWPSTGEFKKTGVAAYALFFQYVPAPAHDVNGMKLHAADEGLPACGQYDDPSAVAVAADERSKSDA